jgi:hypothetical protein
MGEVCRLGIGVGGNFTLYKFEVHVVSFSIVLVVHDLYFISNVNPAAHSQRPRKTS